MSKYGKSIGVLHIDINDADLEIRPKMGDNNKLMQIMMNKDNKNNQYKLMQSFQDFLIGLIKRDNPPQTDDETDELNMFVEFNIMKLFEEILVHFGWSTREEMEKARTESMQDIKNSIGSN